MKWTSEPPTKPGWYWFGNDTGKACVQVSYMNRNGGYYAVALGAVSFDVTMWKKNHEDMRWAGPIPEPTEE
jgi:hypothetical protein